MKVESAENVPLHSVTMEGAQGCAVRWLIGESDGAPGFAMRQFEVAPGGFTPKHSHPYEHEVFVLDGEGVVWNGKENKPLRPGSVVFVPGNQEHQFVNRGSAPLKFLCVVPHIPGLAAATSKPECAEE